MDKSRSLLRQPRRSRRDGLRADQIEQTEPSVRLRLLGGFQVVTDCGLAALPLGAQRVVAVVALHGRPLLRGYVSGSLWLDSPDTRAAANLRSALWRVHRVEPRLIHASGQLLELGEDVVVDLRETEVLARAAMRADSRLEGMARPLSAGGRPVSRLVLRTGSFSNASASASCACGRSKRSASC